MIEPSGTAGNIVSSVGNSCTSSRGAIKIPKCQHPQWVGAGEQSVSHPLYTWDPTGGRSSNFPTENTPTVKLGPYHLPVINICCILFTKSFERMVRLIRGMCSWLTLELLCQQSTRSCSKNPVSVESSIILQAKTVGTKGTQPRVAGLATLPDIS